MKPVASRARKSSANVKSEFNLAAKEFVMNNMSKIFLVLGMLAAAQPFLAALSRDVAAASRAGASGTAGGRAMPKESPPSSSFPH